MNENRFRTDDGPQEDHDTARREFIRRTLLTASMLAAAPATLLPFNGSGVQACDPTTLDLYGLGPFFKEGAPFRQVLAAQDEPGERLFITGILYANDCLTPLKDIVIDIWHADDEGAYSNISTPGDYRLRAKLITNAIGAFSFETIKPGFYLNGPQYRPSHIHVKVKRPNGTELITQLYFEGDPYIATDLAASDSGAVNRIIPLTEAANGLHGVFDLILDVNPPVSDAPSSGRFSTTLLRQNHPNPVSGTTTIPFYLAAREEVNLSVFDLRGRKVRTLIDGRTEEGMHTVEFDVREPKGDRLPAGTYTYRLRAGNYAHSLKMIVE